MVSADAGREIARMIAASPRRPVSHAFVVPVVREIPPRDQRRP